MYDRRKSALQPSEIVRISRQNRIRHVEKLVCDVTAAVQLHNSYGGLATALRKRANLFQKVIVIDSRTVVEIVMWNRLWLGHNFPFSWHVGYHVNQNAKLTQNTSYKSERKHGPHLCMCKRWLNCKMRSGFLSTFNIGSMWGSCSDNNYLGIYMHTKCYRSSL